MVLIAAIALSGCASSDDSAFNAAIRQNTPESYNTFLKNYPDSHYSDKARTLKDDATFAEIRRLNSRRAYEVYISQYPTGRHVTQAKALREQLVRNEQQRRCQHAKAAGNAYKGFVALLNGFLAAGRGDSVAGNAEWGWNAASKQSIPRAIDNACD